MGFLNPLALLALPLAALPLVLDRMGRRRTEPLTFSSLYLLERARRSPARRTRARAPWTAIFRALAIGSLVVAAARPVGPGGGSPEFHRPTRAVVAVDVSRSTAQAWDGASAWAWVAAAADSVLAATSDDDEIALAAVADGVVGWWEGRADGLRRRLSSLAPTDRATDWPATLEALAARSDDGGETYLFTDGSRGARPPAASGSSIEGYRALRVWPAPSASNRAAADARWVASEAVALEARGWGAELPASIEAGRLVGERLLDRRAVPLSIDADGVAAQTWAVADTATLAIAGGDRFPDDDRIAVARGRGGPYRIGRWVPPDRPPEPGTLFWEAALAAAARSPAVERFSSLPELVASAPDLALLPIRPYRRDEAASLDALVESGSRLLFAAECPDPACEAGAGWMPAPGPDVPALRWRIPPPDRATTLEPRPVRPAEDDDISRGVPDHVVARVPVRGALRPAGGPEPGWTWELADGTTALWVRGPIGLWLVPFGPPVTRLGTTPLFPLVADAAIAGWDPRWRRDGTLRIGEPVPVSETGREAIVTGPVGAENPDRWTVTPDGLAPRPERAGLYRIEAGSISFVAVRADPGEGDLRPVEAATWRAAWGEPPVPSSAWPDALFPRRRGPEMTAWALALALSLLALAAWVRSS